MTQAELEKRDLWDTETARPTPPYNHIEWEDDEQALTQVDAIVQAHEAELQRQKQIKKQIRETPYGMAATVDAGKARLDWMPMDWEPNTPASLSDIRKDISKHINEFNRSCRMEASGNQMGLVMLEAFKQVFTRLKREMKKFENSPQQFFDAVHGAEYQIRVTAGNEVLQSDPSLMRFVFDFTKGLDRVCVSFPEIEEMRKKMVDLHISRLTDTQIQQMIVMASGLAMDSQGSLKAAALKALQVISVSTSSEEERKAAYYFLAAMIPRSVGAVNEYNASDPEKPFKPSTMDKILKDSDKFIKLDKIKDAILETAAQGKDVWQFFMDNIHNWPF